MQYLAPPMHTTLRVKTNGKDDVNFDGTGALPDLQEIIFKAFSSRYPRCITLPKICRHSTIKDVLFIQCIGNNAVPEGKHVIVDWKCGMSVLRGADVFVPGILCAPKFLSISDDVAVFADIHGKCLKGSTTFNGECLFVGNGRSKVSRAELVKDNVKHGVGIQVTDPLCMAPSFDGIIGDKFYAQNFPSVVVGHVLDPSPGETVLDMCAAPGGKTTHLYTLMKGKGHLVAVDRSPFKVEKILKNAAKLHMDLTNLTVFAKDSRKLCSTAMQHNTFGPETFDRILLDAPCSALGQRPQIILPTSNKQKNILSSYPTLQKQLFSTAVKLLKVKGIIVYSTCTTTIEENERLVEWALNTFPSLKLDKQIPHVGSCGRPGLTSLTDDQLSCLQYFKPPEPLPLKLDYNWLSNAYSTDLLEEFSSSMAEGDTIGFFIAKFVKIS